MKSAANPTKSRNGADTSPARKKPLRRRPRRARPKLADAAVAYLTCGQVAHRIGVDPAVPARWIKKGRALKDGTVVRLEALRIPGEWRVTPEALERFLRALADDSIPPDRPAARRGRPPKQSPHDAAVDAELAAAGF
jgi:hypothetical protein